MEQVRDGPAGTVVNPGAGKISASSLKVLRAASIPRVAPSSLSKARDWKYEEFMPVVACAAMNLRPEVSDSYFLGDFIQIERDALRLISEICRLL